MSEFAIRLYDVKDYFRYLHQAEDWWWKTFHSPIYYWSQPNLLEEFPIVYEIPDNTTPFTVTYPELFNYLISIGWTGHKIWDWWCSMWGMYVDEVTYQVPKPKPLLFDQYYGKFEEELAWFLFNNHKQWVFFDSTVAREYYEDTKPYWLRRAKETRNYFKHLERTILCL